MRVNNRFYTKNYRNLSMLERVKTDEEAIEIIKSQIRRGDK